MTINIIAGSHCKVKIDLDQVSRLHLLGIYGMYSINLLTPDDFVVYEGEKYKLVSKNKIRQISSTELCEIVNSKVGEEFILDYDYETDQYYEDFDDMSSRMKYLIGRVSDDGIGRPFSNGSPYLFVKSDDVVSSMRYVWQHDDVDPYACLKNIVSVNLNTFQLDCPFSLGGNSFLLNSSMKSELEFRIVGLFDEEVEFTDYLLWQFALETIN